MTISAAAIRIGVPDRDDAKALALPWNAVVSDSGLPLSFANWSIAATAVPSDTPGLRLNDIVTDGNSPWWLMTSGDVVVELFTSVLSGTCCPLDEFT